MLWTGKRNFLHHHLLLECQRDDFLPPLLCISLSSSVESTACSRCFRGQPFPHDHFQEHSVTHEDCLQKNACLLFLGQQGQKQYLYVRAPMPNDTTGNLRTSSCCRILETSSPTPLHIFEPPHPTTKVKDLKPMLNIKKEIWSRRLELML